jgi:hypothetical protein
MSNNLATVVPYLSPFPELPGSIAGFLLARAAAVCLDSEFAPSFLIYPTSVPVNRDRKSLFV